MFFVESSVTTHMCPICQAALTGIQIFMEQGFPSSWAKYWVMRTQALQWSIQNFLISGSSLDSVAFSAFG